MRIKFIMKNIQKLILRKMNNSPYLSGDSIAGLCDYIVPSPLPEQNQLRNAAVKSKSIFINGHDLRQFVNLVGDLLDEKVLISGNSDQNFTSPIVLKSKPRLFLCQNNAIKNQSEIKTLPIGIENIKLARSGFKHQHSGVSSFKYLDRVLIPPMSPTNLTRVSVVQYAKKYPEIFDVESEYLSTRKYFKLLKDYKFVFACEGNGFDTHRLWEILYKNAFPIVLRSDWSDSLSWLNLPIMSIDKIEDVTKSNLREFFEKNSNFVAIETPQLWIPFWKNLLLTKTKNENLLN
jgi:hypothetical protein